MDEIRLSEEVDAVAQMDVGAGARGDVTCPLCGEGYAHRHSPEEIVIYRNGVKRGLYLRAWRKVTHGEIRAAGRADPTTERTE
jgi:hypothetical protein